MNKNNVIAILFAAALLGSTWGAVVNRQKIDLEQQLALVQAELRQVGARPERDRGQVQAGTAASERGADREGQLIKAGQEIAALRKQVKAMEATLAGCNANLQELRGKEGGLETKSGAGLQQQLDEAKAHLLGLEKIVDEKNTALQAAAQEKERLQINTEVLLAKIGEQQRELRTSQEENRQLVKELAADREKNVPPADAQPSQP